MLTPSRLLARGADIQVVKERLGHGSIATTQKYLHKGSGIASDERESGVLARHRGSVRLSVSSAGCGLTCGFAQRSR
jgi:hypothetical protein